VNVDVLRSDSLSSFLRQKIPTNSTARPDAKRVRLDSVEPEAQSIESRIIAGVYRSTDDVVKDVESLRGASAAPPVNGDADGEHILAASDTLMEAADRFLRLLKSQKTVDSTDESLGKQTPKQQPGQIIMLRSSTDRGLQTLYSGLQSDSPENHDHSKDARRLPNGFDLAEPAAMDAALLAPSRQTRKFGDVFGPHRNAKSLEMPRSRTAFRSNTLTFTSDRFQDLPLSLNRSDYRNMSTRASAFLDYAKGRPLSEQDASRKYRDKHAPPDDFKTALIANDAAVNEATDPLAQFKRAFSSFAPETDSSDSAIPDDERYRGWWRKYGEDSLRRIMSSSYPDHEILDSSVMAEQAEDDEFADVVDYAPGEEEEQPPTLEEPDNIDEVLDEISRLLETVHSYQRMRSLETRPSADTTKPSPDEFDTYEILRSQLAILIASVPPFAVAKLDGDKLSDLNISPNIMVEGADYRGTLQPDDITLSKYRAAQPPPRMPQSSTPSSARPAYNAQANMPRYGNANMQNYQHNLSIQAQVAQRQAQTQQYSTPQNMQRGYQPYSQQTANYTSQQPNLQQFQRPSAAANGYGNWTNSASTTPHTGYAQTPSQPGYQQRAQQQAAMYAHTQAQTPSRPMPNGQMNYQNVAPQYQRPPYAAQQGQGMQTGMVNGGQ
jgi:hypothetical protein